MSCFFQTFIRHGDRTLCSAETCWPSDAAVYNCSLTRLMGSLQDRTDPHPALGMNYRVLFEPNEEWLAGDCGIGQLTSRGYQQEVNNGRAVASAYVAGGNGFLPSTLTDDNAGMFYLRSDNE